MDFQRRILLLAADTEAEIPPSEADCVAAFGAAGQWFYQRLSVQKHDGSKVPSEIGDALARLMQQLRGDEGLADALLLAFDQDREFHAQIAADGFLFQFPNLGADMRSVLKDLFEPFYTKLLANGFPPEVHGGADKLDRARLLDRFEAANPMLEVCPACDGQKPSRIEQKSYADADHYFPKSLYPFLCIHPLNLVPICIECNQRFKRDKDPVDDHAVDPLRNTFFPYVASAFGEVDVQISRDAPGKMNLTIIDRLGAPSRRVDSMNRVFELEGRWKDRLRHQIEMIRQDVAKAGRRLKEDGVLRDRARGRREIELRPNELAERIGRRTFMILESKYRDFAVNDPDEFAVLMDYFTAE